MPCTIRTMCLTLCPPTSSSCCKCFPRSWQGDIHRHLAWRCQTQTTTWFLSNFTSRSRRCRWWRRWCLCPSLPSGSWSSLAATWRHNRRMFLCFLLWFRDISIFLNERFHIHVKPPCPLPPIVTIVRTIVSLALLFSTVFRRLKMKTYQVLYIDDFLDLTLSLVSTRKVLSPQLEARQSKRQERSITAAGNWTLAGRYMAQAL